MREILFRGKRVENGEWVEGYFVNAADAFLSHDAIVPFIIESDSMYFGYGEFTMANKVIPETVCQFTGLTDKNGKKIFEGDILKIAKNSDGIGTYYIPPLDYPVNVVVKWDLCAWMWETLCEDKRYIGFPNAWCHYECEVIGNTHDNPELMKGGEIE